MNQEYPQCAVGTMAWGSNVYGKIVQGNSVSEEILAETLKAAEKTGMILIDTAHKYGLGYAEKVIGEYGTEKLLISTKYTPSHRKGKGDVAKALDQDLKILNRESVDIYWLHLPVKVKENITEIIPLVKDGKIKHVGVSNFNLKEIKYAEYLLKKHGIKLYGVQNHYSLLSRDWEENGVIDWCHEHHVKFFAWSVMEQGALTGKMHYKRFSIRGIMYNRKVKKLKELFHIMERVGQKYQLTIAQVNIAWVLTKGIVPICGCKKPYQVEELAKASKIKLEEKDVIQLELAAKQSGIHIPGDMFRKLLPFA